MKHNNKHSHLLRISYHFFNMSRTTSAFSSNLLQAIYNNYLSDSSNITINISAPGSDPRFLTLDNFLTDPSYSTLDSSQLGYIYAALVNNLYAFIDKVKANSVPNLKLPEGIPSFRILITVSDGTVFFDSFKRTSGSNGTDLNTYDNFLKKAINENHASRHYIRQSIDHVECIESKWSSTTKALETYYAKRIGMSAQLSIGAIAFSYSTSY